MKHINFKLIHIPIDLLVGGHGPIPPEDSEFIVTENDDYIMTENDEFLVTEN